MKAKDLAKILMGDPESEVFILDNSRSLACPVGQASSIEEVEASEGLTCVGGGDVSAIVLVANPNADSVLQFDLEGEDDEDDDEGGSDEDEF